MIEIVPYSAYWPTAFAEIAAHLHSALGDLALRIDHIGSTSIPGLAAKDIIDVQITLPADASFDRIEVAMAAAGYIQKHGVCYDHQPPGLDAPQTEWEKRLFGYPPSSRQANLHVRRMGQANQRYALLFRDYLREHPAVALAYAEVKRQLARYHPDDRTAYVEIKDPVCDVITAAAEEWAARISWKP
jgi:GrpB-like predicted nucleotidyltransferase (UPF0157 family)